MFDIVHKFFHNRKKNCVSETPDRDLPRLVPISNGTFSKSHKMDEKSASSMINTEIKSENEMQQAIHTKSTMQGTIHILRKHFLTASSAKAVLK